MNNIFDWSIYRMNTRDNCDAVILVVDENINDLNLNIIECEKHIIG